jgi:hypothetical protein
MATSTILPLPAATKESSPAKALAEAFEITTGRILKVMCTSWSDGRISYRISIEQGGNLTIAHRLYQERQTTTINDLLWTLMNSRSWKMRPAYMGSGFIAFHDDYAGYIRRETCADLLA